MMIAELLMLTAILVLITWQRMILKKAGNMSGFLYCIIQKRHQLDSAKVYYLRAKEIREKANDMEGQAYSYIEIGVLYNETGDGKNGVSTCLRGLEIADKIGFPELQRDACDCLAAAYELV